MQPIYYNFFVDLTSDSTQKNPNVTESKSLEMNQPQTYKG